VDIVRPEVKRQKKIRRIVWGAVGLVVVVLVSVGLKRLKPAAPTVDKSTIWTDTVKRGPMLREVRGLGTLVPVTIQVVPALTDGQVIKRFILPGTPVKPDTPIFQMINPELEQAQLDAEYQLKGAQAEYRNMKAQLQNQLMDKRAQQAAMRSSYHTAVLARDNNEKLKALGLVSDLVVKTSEVQAAELEKQNDIAEKQVETFAGSIDAQMAVEQSKVDQAQALYNLKKTQVDDLTVRAGIDGILQELEVEVGQKVTQGTALAKVEQPTHLKAQLKIAETQAKDVAIGQPASIDTHNGLIPGKVSRIDPAVQNGTVTVDVALEGPLPQGARPDLSVEGTIELERLADVLYVGRPVHGEANSTIGLFKVTPDGSEADRVTVKLGRTSVNTVEIVGGLNVGDTVVLSDMSAYDSQDRVELK